MNSIPANLDPWVASSLLQKAIRRGETDLARQAAAIFHRHRGQGIWRRLISIAVEDVGIGDIELLAELVRLGTDRQLRQLLGSDAELVDDFCVRLATAPKDRSTDHVYSAATKLETALADRVTLAAAASDDLRGIASSVSEPSPRRAVAALLACTRTSGGKTVLRPGGVQQFLTGLPVRHAALEDAVLRLAQTKFHPFCLMLPIIWSLWWHLGSENRVIEEPMPPPESEAGVPLYAFDMHTAAGKRAIAMLPNRSLAVGAVLRPRVPEDRWTEVALTAAFYADAVPIAKRADWSAGRLLEFVGIQADMTSAGCPAEAVDLVVSCVRDNLPAVNQLRREVLRRP